MSRAVLTLASSTCLMGCLITREPVFQAVENLPPSVLGSAETPLRQIIQFHVDENPDGGGTPGVAITAIVRDANIDDRLVGRIFVNLEPDNLNINQFYWTEVPIPPDTGSTDPYSRSVSFVVPPVFFGAGCNWIEFEVSRDFVELPSRAPRDPGRFGDLGTAIWFVEGLDAAGTRAELDGCTR